MTDIADPTSGRRVDVHVRDAAEADAPFLAWTCLTAARSHLPLGIWDRLLGWDEPRVLDYLTDLVRTGPEHLFHWRRFLIAQVDGTPAAALSAYDPAVHGFDVYLPIFYGLWAERVHDDRERAELDARAGTVTDAFIEAPDRCWTVESVATRPEYRRLGLQDRLLEVVLERGRQYGAEVTRISVFVGNEPAAAAYRKHGYRLLQRSLSEPWAELMGCPGIDHLVQDL